VTANSLMKVEPLRLSGGSTFFTLQ
jgi:hypothetical protein